MAINFSDRDLEKNPKMKTKGLMKRGERRKKGSKVLANRGKRVLVCIGEV